ncbi:hypothetical protein ASE12_17980 [Aeromicrobium sp. Root236]|uniref:Ig-like domain-containing protein n=1 Tax=Aeromicrobium sp. Root236 TaxID=1736498 RepID=UPI0006FCD6AA|nr:Ig-like domain-containing protein [Aeromicrobium sp. Root236]KRC66491.1 hypothetical protein ASE12_17980 [Aeromicrobium sp. Root236]
MTTPRSSWSARKHVALTLARLLVLATTVSVLVLGQAGAASATSASFAPAIAYDSGGFPIAMTSGDFNGDDYPDLAVVSDSSGVWVLLGGAGGTFGAPTRYPVGSEPRSIATGDFNGDGNPDLVVPNAASNNVSVLLGAPDGTFGGATNFAVGTFPVSVAIGDFNGDGDPDLAVANQHSYDVSVLLGGTGGTFGAPTSVPAGDNPSSVAVGDFNHDNDPDLAIGNYGATVSVLLGGPGATFGSATGYPAGSTDDPVTSIVVDDFNADSDPDLVVGYDSGVGVTVLLGAAGGSFAAPTTYAIPHAFDVAVADLNDDSHSDLAVAENGTEAPDGTVHVLHGNGDGTFGDETQFPTFGGAQSVVIADVNADHEPDLVAGNYASRTQSAGGIAVLLNTRAAPDTTITAGPSGPTNEATQTFTFTSSKAGSTFECRPHSDQPFTACTSPYTTGPFVAGTRTFEVRATDPTGNIDPTPASRTFTVDITAPNTTITGGPDGLTNQDTPTFTFTSSQAGSTFECRRDVDEPFEACTSPWQFPARVDNGPHTFEVRATDTAGNVDPTPATRDYNVDTTPSQAYFTDGPSGPTNDATPTFTFQSIQSDATFECRVDGGDFTACDSPFTTSELPDGEHTVSVRAIDSLGNVQPVPDTRTFTVDTVAADTSITGGPDGPTSDNTPTFTFTSPEPGVTFECRLDDARFNPCTSPYDTGLLGGSDFTFQVRARDAAGNVDPTPATRSFTVDRNPPTTSITSAPGTVTNDNTPTVGFTSSKPDSTFECRVDDAAFAACTPPHTFPQLADGEHVVAVRATDSIGNVDPDPAERTFRVDTAPPDTTINSGPSGLINDNTPEFGWDATSDAATYECHVDDKPFAACASPETTAALSDGQHTFELRAIDAAGNVDPTPAKRTFTVDTTARVTGITGGPSGLINDPTPTFTFATSDADSTFECRVSPRSFGPCTSPYTSPAEPDGEHTFQVRSIDPAGNVESPPVSRTFTVDTNAPDTSMTSGPTGTIDDQTPTFGFSSPESGATLECRVDDADFGPCASPYTTALLGNGSHTFEARATDAAGNTDATPASRTFTIKVDATPPKTVIDSGPADLSNQVKPTFTFSANEPSTFECKVDAGSFVPCESGDTFGPLGEGSHTFAVRATDLAGNVDPTTATRDWIIDTTPPQTTITSGPSPLSLTMKATLAFTSSEGGSSFQCQLEGGAWQACSSPKTYTNALLGNHTFAVRAIDPAGNTDPTPATRNWFTLGLIVL